MLSNFRRKVRIWTGEEIPEDGALFPPYRVGSRNLHVVLYKGTVMKGWIGSYHLRAPQPYFRMALDAGIGSKNSQGFGCVELRRDIRQEENMNASSVQRSGEHGGSLAESGKK
ncbi:CRISPR-associated endoribonuclease Cas6 [Candidatus Methylacidithermus pantelleriae]|uniref:CRISPR-associated endoribonuclease Cas6 n=1 Tax=Candidatus Methylacidithermus pantelleriae TaxID=2744239 RepID=UPI0038B2D246